VNTTRRIALITLSALILVVGVWYGALWRPAEKHLATLRAQQVLAANNVLTLQAQADALRAQQKQLPQDKVALAKLAAAIPADPGLDQLIKVIDNAAGEAGVSLTSLGTPPPSGWGTSGPSSAAAQGPGPQDMTISVGFQGSDRGMLQFVTDLDSEARLFVVDSFSLNSAPRASGPSSSTGSAGASTYSVTVTAFYVSGASNNPVFPGKGIGE
jgi:Tfp pilus assembly protein PilO